jgi:hypothetical protein
VRVVESSLNATIMGNATRRGHRPSLASRRFGYAVSILIDLALWYGVLVWPGWSVLPFLTPATELVLPIVITSFIVGALVNVVWFVHDPAWLRALGNLVTTMVAVAVGVRVWEVFPFDFGAAEGWPLLVRVLLGLGIVGALIGALTWFIVFVVALIRARDA